MDKFVYLEGWISLVLCACILELEPGEDEPIVPVLLVHYHVYYQYTSPTVYT